MSVLQRISGTEKIQYTYSSFQESFTRYETATKGYLFIATSLIEKHYVIILYYMQYFLQQSRMLINGNDSILLFTSRQFYRHVL